MEEKTQIAENIKCDSVSESKLAQKEKDCELVMNWIVESVREIKRSLYICALAASLFIGCVIGLFISVHF